MFFDKKTDQSQVFLQKNDLTFSCSFKLLRDLDVPYFFISLINSQNILVYGKNSFQHDVQHKTILRAGDVVEIRGSIELSVAPGRYVLEVALHSVDRVILSLQKIDIMRYLDENRRIIIGAQAEIVVLPLQNGYYFRGLVDLPDKWNCLWPT